MITNKNTAKQAAKNDSLTYRQRISMTDADKAEQGIDLQVESATLGIMSAVHGCNQAIARHKSALNIAKSAIPFNPDAVIVIIDELGLQQRRLEQLDQLRKELGL